MIPTPGRAGAARGRGVLLLADISGYTAFLQGVADAHHALIVEEPEPPAAYALMSSLLETITDSVVPPFRLAKLEGDAVFAVAYDADFDMRGAAVPACLRACHSAFRHQLGEAHSQWTCSCAACARIDDLSLKFVMHHGDYVAQLIAGREEFLGPEVNVVHRLLKNHAQELVGPMPYALLTDAALAALEVPSDGMVAGVETYEHIPPVPVHVLPLVDADVSLPSA